MTKEKKEKAKEIRHDTNPFVEDMKIQVGAKSIRVSNQLGKDRSVLVNESTGEVRGTHVATYRKVDQTKFVKLFSQNIGLIFDLKPSGIKAFNVLVHAIQNLSMNRDRVTLDRYVLEDFLAQSELKLSFATFMRGLKELEDAKIIAKHRKRGDYFINPNFVFNGDRIAFSTVIEKKPSTDMEEN